jgi:hypothetical protein
MASATNRVAFGVIVLLVGSLSTAYVSIHD